MRNFKITVSGKTYDVAVEEIGGSPVSAPVAAAPAAAQVTAPTTAPAAAQAPAGGTQVAAPMPGVVLNIVAANGSQVKKGDVILVLEAMKMENDITAPCDGTVTVVAAKGASVNTGDVLASIN